MAGKDKKPKKKVPGKKEDRATVDSPLEYCLTLLILK